MDEGFICGYKLPEDFHSPLTSCAKSISDQIQGALGLNEPTPCNNIKKALYSSFCSANAARTLAMVSWVEMVTGLPRQIPESPCHISSQQPTFSPCFIWRGILSCYEHHVLLDLLEYWTFVVEVEYDCTMAEVVHFIRNHLWSMLDYSMYKR